MTITPRTGMEVARTARSAAGHTLSESLTTAIQRVLPRFLPQSEVDIPAVAAELAWTACSELAGLDLTQWAPQDHNDDTEKGA